MSYLFNSSTKKLCSQAPQQQIIASRIYFMSILHFLLEFTIVDKMINYHHTFSLSKLLVRRHVECNTKKPRSQAPQQPIVASRIFLGATIRFVICLFRWINSQCATRQTGPRKGEMSPRYQKRLQFYLKSIFSEIYVLNCKFYTQLCCKRMPHLYVRVCCSLLLSKNINFASTFSLIKQQSNSL